MIPTTRNRGRSWTTRWSHLARAAGIDPSERILLALSGGADSVLLLHLLADATPRPNVRAIHVDHGLRGAESDADARFCENLCRALGVPFSRCAVELDADGPSLEARAREARYTALAAEARRTRHTTIVTGHHSDDALETLLWRWTRGTTLAGLRGARASTPLPRAFQRDDAEDAPELRLVRPLLPLRRAEVRRLLADRGLSWREDSSNTDPKHTRSRIRHGVLPWVERTCGADGLENLRAFGEAVERLEDSLAGATAHLAWAPAPYAAASRAGAAADLGGVVARAELMAVATPLRRRALWRLLTEGTGASPGRSLLDHVLLDLASGRCTRHTLPGDWVLILRSDVLHLVPSRRDPGALLYTTDDEQELLPFAPSPADLARARRGEPSAAPTLRAPVRRPLPIPGILTLPDGRRISAERIRVSPDTPAPRAALEVELDAEGMPPVLHVRFAERGDRFHALGAPGSKPLLRFLADRGVPREDRRSVPVVAAGDEIVWVVGIEPGERHRIRPRTRERLRLALHHGEAPR